MMYVNYVCDFCNAETPDQEVNSGDEFEVSISCWNCGNGTMFGFVSYDEMAISPYASVKPGNKIKVTF